MTDPRTRSRPRGVALALIPLAVALLAGCSAASGGDAASGGPDDGRGTSTYADSASWNRAMFACLDGLGHPSGTADLPEPPARGIDPDADRAWDDCLQQVGPAPLAEPSALTAEESTRLQQAVVDCAKEAGYDVEMGSDGRVDLSSLPDDVRAECAGNG